MRATVFVGTFARHAPSPLSAILLMAVAGMIMSVAGCEEGGRGSRLSVSQEDSGRTLVMSPGQRLVVSLPGNPTTGYSWSCRQSVPGILREESSEYLADRLDTVGSGGTMRYEFIAVEAGSTALLFRYARSWEQGVPAAQEAEYGIVVR